MNRVGSEPPILPRLWRTTLRWFWNPLQRSYEWRFYPQFWQVRNRWQKLTFWFSKRGYSVRSAAQTASESTSIFFLIIKTVFWQALAAGLLVGVLGLLDSDLRGTTSPLRWFARHSLKAKVALEWFHQTWPDPSLSANTLSTLAQISGVFLGLYFTAISVVAGTNYARVPAQILDALVREKVGNLYIRVVALFGGISLILLGASNLGYRPGVLNLVVVSSLGIASLFSFIELGRRAFYFFDSTKLVQYVAGDILQAARSSTCAGFSWRDSAYQDYYRKKADSDVRIYEDVILLSDSESHLEGRSLLALVFQFLVLLEAYSEEKKQIPSDSLWFERIYRHRSWLTTEEARVNIAIQTGTGLEPEYIPDHSWFEKRIGDLVSRTLKGLKDRGDFARAITVCTRIEGTLGILGKEMATDEALSLLQRVKTFAIEIAEDVKVEGKTPSELAQTLAPALGLADVCGMGFISILLGFANRVDSISAESFSAIIDKVDFRRPQSLYQTGLPRNVVEQLEYLYRGIQFEAKVESKQVTPRWYCQQIAALGMARYFVQTCEALLSEMENTYAVQAEALSAKKRYLFAAQVVQRGLEACHKFHFRVEKFREWFKAFSKLRRVQDIPWPEFDPEKIHQRIESVRDRLLIVLADSVGGIASLPASKDIPDYLGQTYEMLADECYKSMAGGEEALFIKLFLPFFQVSIAVQDRLRVELRDRDVETALVYVTEPVEDLLTICGYALVYSELDDKSFWGFVKASWDNYLSRVPNAADAVKFWLSTISYRRSLFAILPRDLRRTAWTQDLMHHLQQRGLADDLLGTRFYGAREETPKHRSIIIRVIARNAILFEKAADIFAATYLMKRPEADIADSPKSAQDFAIRVEREARRNNPENETENEA
jgi:hypothetical protein